MEMKFFILLIASVVFVAGCASQTAAPSGPPSFVIKSPAEGQVIQGSSVNIVLDGVENIILVSPNGTAVPGQGHFHFFLDNANEVMTPRLTHTYENVAPGQHIIRMELRRGDHTQFNPAVIKAVAFTVSSNQLPSPSTIPAPTQNTSSNTTTNMTSGNTTNTTEVCAQVITPATKDGQCVEYPTPCDVPQGWTVVNECPVQVKEFNITASNWKFEPGTITVNLGDTVRINAKSVDVTHGLFIPQYNVDMQLAPGSTETATFTADQAGSFNFFCDVFCGSGHNDMKGTLVVNP